MKFVNISLSNLPLYLLNKIAFLFCISLFIISIFWVYLIFNSDMPTLFVLLFGYTMFSFLGGVYFLWSQKESDSNHSFFYQSYLQPSLFYPLFFIIIYIFWVISILGYIYTKPFFYYILASTAIVFISIQILFMHEKSNKKHIFLILIQILVFAFFHRISSNLINPNLFGPDTFYHFNNIQSLIIMGHISQNFFHYYFFPSYYYTQSIAGILISFSKFSFEAVNAFQSIITVILGYIIGKEIFNNNKKALMCSLLISIAPMVVFCNIYNTSKIGALPLFLMILWLQLRILKSKKIEYLILLLVILIALFFWHPELSMPVFSILLASLFANILTASNGNKKNTITNFSFYLLLLFYIIIYLWYLFFIHISLGESIVNILFFDKSGTTLVNTFPLTLFGYTEFLSFIKLLIQLFFADLGITLPLFFAIYLGFIWLLRPGRQEIFLIICIIFLHLNPLFGIFSGKLGLGGERSLIATSVLIVFLSAGGIIEIFKLNHKNKIMLFIFTMAIFSLSSTSSYLIGDGNDFFNDRISIQIMYNTQTQDRAAQFLKEAVPSNYNVQWETCSISPLSSKDRGYILTDYLKISYRSRSMSLDRDLKRMMEYKNLVYSNGNNALTLNNNNLN